MEQCVLSDREHSVAPSHFRKRSLVDATCLVMCQNVVMCQKVELGIVLQ